MRLLIGSEDSANSNKQDKDASSDDSEEQLLLLVGAEDDVTKALDVAAFFLDATTF